MERERGVSGESRGCKFFRRFFGEIGRSNGLTTLLGLIRWRGDGEVVVSLRGWGDFWTR